MSGFVVSFLLDGLLYGALLSVGLTCFSLYRNECFSTASATSRMGREDDARFAPRCDQ